MSIDLFIGEFDRVLRTLATPAVSVRPMPGCEHPPNRIDPDQSGHVVGLMRVNHCGEICAQALYQGQALTSRDDSVSRALREAAFEETEHLAWTERRIAELGGRKSVLNPLFYFGALGFGLVAGAFGDKWSLGFLAETERQVEAHLAGHLDLLPEDDLRSRAIVEQMRADESRHAEMAADLGAAELPLAVKVAMKIAAKVMTEVAFRF